MSRQPEPKPPKWILSLLNWWVKADLREEIQGDLYELFEEYLQKGGSPARARRAFIWNALRFCRSYTFNKDHLNLYPMLWKNYYKIAWRQLLRDKLYAFINILGIAVGIACFLIVFFYIQTERSFDQHHPNKDRLYRVSQNFLSESNEPAPLAYSYNPLSRTLEDRVPLVEKTARIFNISGGYGEDGGQFTNIENHTRYIEDQLYFADSTFFDLFAYNFVEGIPERALEAPFLIVLKASTAKKYFGDGPALGKVLEYRDDRETFRFTVGGVVEEPQGPTHFDFRLLASFSSLRIMMPWIDSWHHPPVYHYALLQDGATLPQFQQYLADLPGLIFDDHMAEEVSFDAQPVTDIHLHSQRTGELQVNGQVSNLRLFGIIGLLVLLIACINYMNLATARAGTRIKEVNIRRIFGAGRGQLIRQFLGESLLFTTLGFMLALILVRISIPYLNDLFSTPIQMRLILNWDLPFLLLGLLLFVALLAGFYPSVFLSAIRLSKNIQGQWRSSVTSAPSVRKGLVVFQFAVSCALITMTLLVHRQVQHLQSRHPGFEQDQVMVIPLRDEKDQVNYETLKANFLQISQVTEASGSSGYPGGRGFSEFFIIPKQGAFDSLEVLTLTVDHDFAETFGLSIQAGRDFSTDFPTDTPEGFLVNEALARRLNWQDPAGQELVLHHYYNGEKRKRGKVVGVLEDFPYRSLREPIQPILFHILPRSYFYNYLSLKISPSALEETIAQLGSTWRDFNPERTFEYYFLDDAFARLYEQERQFNALFRLFAALAVLIACLGLFALAAFSIERRQREVAVRKVLGASTSGIMVQIAGQFTRLALIALVIAIPPAWYIGRQWLNNFAYRIDIGWWTFTLSGLVVLLLALLTCSYHAFKAANLNPAQVLKHGE